MDLVNLLPHRRNTAVTVNGRHYAIDAVGICRGVDDVDAAKMLQNTDAWRQHDGKAPVPPARPAARMGLIGNDGAVVTPPAPEPVPAPPPVSAEPNLTKSEAPKASSWEIPADGVTWPDPIVEMPIAYLRAMADAYEVKWTRVTTTKTLVKKIMAEMYPEA